MTKEELVTKLKVTKEWNKTHMTLLWQQAFKMYKDATGQSLSFSCSMCYKTCKKWLTS